MRSAFTYLSTYMLVGICLLALVFTSCRYEGPEDAMHELQLQAYIQKEKSLVRATDYTNLDASQAAFNAALIISTGSDENERYSTASMQWDGSSLSTNVRLEEGEYWFYGYMPWNDYASFDLATKTLTIPNIPGLSLSNAMLIKAKQQSIDASNATVALQMDHLMAKVTPYFYIDSVYNALRDIKITQVTLRIPQSGASYTASITYNTDIADASNTSYTHGWSSSSNSAFEVSRSVALADAVNLPKERGNAISLGEFYICPQQTISELEMSVTYTVYDKDGNVTRQNATATNAILRSYTNLERANNYKLYIQVIPTYLYVLSDYDEGSVMVIE